eukprot:2349856-Rhodomonas_salina.2
MAPDGYHELEHGSSAKKCDHKWKLTSSGGVSKASVPTSALPAVCEHRSPGQYRSRHNRCLIASYPSSVSDVHRKIPAYD